MSGLNGFKSNKPGWSGHWRIVKNIFRFPKNTAQNRTLYLQNELNMFYKILHFQGEDHFLLKEPDG